MSHAGNAGAAGTDVTCRPAGLLVWYGLPIASLFASGQLIADPRLLGLAWAAAFAVMGGQCLVNARRCGRVHCRFTGPWLLLAGVLSLLHGWGLVPGGMLTWDVIGNGALLGAALLWCGSECVLGRYRAPGL